MSDLIAEWKLMKYWHIRSLKAIYIVAFIALTSAFFSCQSRKEKKTNSTEKRWLTFENDYFSLMYPKLLYRRRFYNRSRQFAEYSRRLYN